METVHEQDNRLANDMLERNYYSYFRKGHKKIEIFLNGVCKANCKYCYLKKHQEDLFPIESYNLELILNNFQKVLNWYKTNKFNCPIDIFSAEWLTIPALADGVINMLIESFKDSPYRPSDIIVADNMMFIKDPKAVERVQNYLDQLGDIGIEFHISCSIDGKMCDQNRTPCDDQYYEDLKTFINKNHLRCHPMVSAYNVKYQIENYLWWVENFSKDVSDNLMMLEIREDNWNEESIADLIRFCDFLIDYKFENQFNRDKKKFLKYIMKAPIDGISNIAYNNIALCQTPFDVSSDTINCSLQDNLTIRLTDLSFSLCHRLYYPELEIGKFNSNETELTNLEVTNVALLILKDHYKQSTNPHCEKCRFVGACIGPCLGANYETYGNPLIPIKQSCDMLKAKNTFLIYKYNSMGLFEYLDDIPMRDSYRVYFKDLINSILGGLSANGNT